MSVARPERWDRALASLTAVLETVTGDLWEVVFRPLGRLPALAQKSVREGPLTFTDEDYAHDVALFSGGLDSLGWAAQQAALPFPRALLLVTFAERNFEALQDQVYEAVRGLRRRPVRRLTQSQTVRKPRGSGIELELTTRSRGLLYAATAVHAAAAEHVPVVHPPENGQLALNPTPSAARAGACSTRSVHPWTVHHLNRVISEVAEPGSAIRVENPFATLTKGDVCAAAHDPGMPHRVLEPTLSCGAPDRRNPLGPHSHTAAFATRAWCAARAWYPRSARTARRTRLIPGTLTCPLPVPATGRPCGGGWTPSGACSIWWPTPHYRPIRSLPHSWRWSSGAGRNCGR
nr:hypothetical protein OG546_15680 [Streptomyces antimycoticus]